MSDLALKRLNRLRKDNSEYQQNWKAIEDTFSFLGRKKAFTGERFDISTVSATFIEASTLDIKTVGNPMVVALLIDSANKTTSTGLVDGIAASTSGGINSIIQILRDGKSFARFQLDSGTEAPSFFCLDSSPTLGNCRYTLQVRNSAAGNAMTITNMRLIAFELF